MNKVLETIGDKKQFEAFLADNRQMIIKVAAVGLLVVAAFFLFLAGRAEPAEIIVEGPEAAVEAEEEKTSQEASPDALIYVDIGGAVKTPMVAALQEGSRVEDAIAAAGGVTEQADLSQINRAAFVEDGEKIFIPISVAAEENEDAGDGAGNGTSVPDMYQGYQDGRVNINTADAEELQELNGVGPATAEKIIAYRKENGRFDTIEDIKNVSGIGDKTFEKFKEDIKV